MMKLGITCLLSGVYLLLSIVPLSPKGSKKAVTLQTVDAVTIKGTLSTPSGKGSRMPAVILIHQAGSDRNEWDDLVSRLLEKGFVTFAFDLRGHGESDSVKTISALFNNPDLAPNDLRAAIRFLSEHDSIDKMRVGILGSSVGANLACVAAGHPDYQVKTAVAISGKTSAVFNLAGHHKEFQMRSLFLISSKDEQGGKRAEWAQELYTLAKPPHKLEIVENSSAHGTKIFKDAPELSNQIVAWFAKNL